MLNSEILDVGYIYQITSESDDKIYYGSSKNWMERLRSHNAKNNKCMTMYMTGKKNLKVLETFHKITREDLQKNERVYIENHNEEKLQTYMKSDSIFIEVDLKQGQEQYECYTCDFTHDYIDINAQYRRS